MKRTVLRVLSTLLTFVFVFLQLGTAAIALTNDQKDRIDKILGVYDGSYTANQGITGLTLSVFRTSELLNDPTLLQKFADVANSCGSAGSDPSNKSFSSGDIKEIVSAHSGEYIALFNYFPLVYESGQSPNPNVEEGLYTMTVNYDESSRKYEFVGSQWIQHDTYVFADLKNIVLEDDTLKGDVYGDYNYLFWMEYGKVGEVSVSSGKSHSGYRIDFENRSVSLGIDEKRQIRAIVKNNEGLPAADPVEITWFSSNESIASVSGESWETGKGYAFGTVVGVSEGITEVCAELENNRVAVCTVVVSQNGTAAPLEVETSYEFLSKINETASEGNVTTYAFKPKYRIQAVVSNSGTNAVTNVRIHLNVPDSVEVSRDTPVSESFDRIESGGSVTAEWEVLAEGDTENVTSFQYSVSAESDQTALAFAYRTVAVDPLVDQDNRLDFGLDIWNFINSADNFTKDYYINKQYYNALMDGLSNVEKEQIDQYLGAEWHGSCFGMSSIAALVKTGHLTFSEPLKKQPAPKNDLNIYSLITYYHMSQKFNSRISKKIEQYSMSRKDLLIGLVNAVEKVKSGGPPVVLSFFHMKKDFDIHSLDNDYTEGHTIVAYDIEYIDHSVKDLVGNSTTSYDKKIKIYDPNDKNNPIYMHINSDYSRWLIDGYCQNQTKADGLYWFKNEGNIDYIADTNIWDAKYHKDSEDNYYSKLISNLNTRDRIEFKSGTVSDGIVVCGVNILEQQNSGVVAYVDGLFGSGTSPAFGYAFKGGVDEITVLPDPSGENKKLDYRYEFRDVSLSAAAENAESVVFSENRSVELTGSGRYSLAATYNEGCYSSDWYHYEISGSTPGRICLSQNDDGFTVISGDELKNITLTLRGNSSELSERFSTEYPSVLVTEKNQTLFLLADSDEDGTYETRIKTVTAKRGRSIAGSTVKAVVVVVVILIAAAACLTVILASRKKPHKHG